MITNITTSDRPEEQISNLLSLISPPARIKILFILSDLDACVCHLEAVLHERQARISQHLMDLRKAGLVTTRRDGRNIYYHLERPEVVTILKQTAQITGIKPESLFALTIRPVKDCPCPDCNPGSDPNSSCDH